MGTSQRYKSSVKGQPNWGKASASITSLGNAVADEKKLEENRPNLPQLQYEKQKRKIESRISKNYRQSINHTIRAAGGTSSVSSGSSKAFGFGGINIIQNFAHAISDIHEQGLSNWLLNHNYGSLEGKNADQVKEILTVYVQDELVALDDTAANEALEYLMDMLNEKLGPDIEQFDSGFNQIFIQGEMKELIDHFFAIYIYSHLSQSVYEKLEKNKGSEFANDTMGVIKDLILEDIQGLPKNNSVTTINWGTEEGEQFCKEEFNRIIHIYLDDDDNN